VKIAMWTSWQTRCGIAAYTASLVESLQALGVEVDVIPVPYTEREPGREAETIARLNAAELVHVQHEYTFFGGIAPTSSSLPRYYRQLTVPRVVTAHTVFTAAELLRVAQETRWRQRIAKELLSRYPPYRDYVERQPFAGAKAVIVHTGAARDRLAARHIPADRIHVLPAGVPAALEASPEEVAAFRERFRLAGHRVATIFGYVTADKGYETALEALGKLPPTIKLLIAGGTRVERESGYLDQLRETIRSRGLESRIAITGFLEEREIAAAMAVTDVVLVPHLAANGSYSVMVALGYGKPVLASDLPCFAEIAAQSPCVELFPPEDEYALADRMGLLMASSGIRSRMAADARQYAGERSWDAVAEKTLAIYLDALRKPPL
jgi:glycosyltransferase involved in cell wall biosynthesis